MKQGLDNLGKRNIHESESEISGYFIGYLPEERVAEFVDRETRNPITARVSRVVPDAEEILNRRHQNATISVRIRRIGNASPRYTITDMNF